MADVLVDTDVFIDHLRGAVELKPGRNRLHYSVVTRAELFAGNSATDLVSQLLAPFRELAVDRPVAERAGRVVREFQLRMPDALIAATALGEPPHPDDEEPEGFRQGPGDYGAEPRRGSNVGLAPEHEATSGPPDAPFRRLNAAE